MPCGGGRGTVLVEDTPRGKLYQISSSVSRTSNGTSSMSNTLELLDQLLPKVKLEHQEMMLLRNRIHELEVLFYQKEGDLEEALAIQATQQETIIALRQLNRRKDDSVRQKDEELRRAHKQLRHVGAERDREIKARHLAESDQIEQQQHHEALLQQIEEDADQRVIEARQKTEEAEGETMVLIERATKLHRKLRKTRKERDAFIKRASQANDSLEAEREYSRFLREELELRGGQTGVSASR